jgi:hypothetical protein
MNYKIRPFRDQLVPEHLAVLVTTNTRSVTRIAQLEAIRVTTVNKVRAVR